MNKRRFELAEEYAKGLAYCDWHSTMETYFAGFDACLNHLSSVELEGMMPFDLDRWFFEHPDLLKPPELCRNRMDKIVYYKSQVSPVIAAKDARIKELKKENERLRALIDLNSEKLGVFKSGEGLE